MRKYKMQNDTYFRFKDRKAHTYMYSRHSNWFWKDPQEMQQGLPMAGEALGGSGQEFC